MNGQKGRLSAASYGHAAMWSLAHGAGDDERPEDRVDFGGAAVGKGITYRTFCEDSSVAEAKWTRSNAYAGLLTFTRGLKETNYWTHINRREDLTEPSMDIHKEYSDSKQNVRLERLLAWDTAHNQQVRFITPALIKNLCSPLYDGYYWRDVREGVIRHIAESKFNSDESQYSRFLKDQSDVLEFTLRVASVSPSCSIRVALMRSLPRTSKERHTSRCGTLHSSRMPVTTVMF